MRSFFRRIQKIHSQLCFSLTHSDCSAVRGIQIILNSTSWERETHSGAYVEMKVSDRTLPVRELTVHWLATDLPHFSLVDFG
jgi:hypothetical protein